MADASTPVTAVHTDSGPTGRRPRRPLPSPRGLGRWLLAIVMLAVIALVASAVIPSGSHTHAPARFGVARTARASSTANSLPTHVSKVFGATGSAKQYGTLDGERENQGVDAQGQLTSDLTPVSANGFRHPIAEFRTYAGRWAMRLGGDVATLRSDLAAGNRAASERAWEGAFSDYLHLGAVYGLLPARLDQQLAEVPPSLGDRRFPGLHMIEKGLWTGASPASLVPVAAAVSRAVVRLRKVLPTVPITPLDYATRAHEILEDAQRDLMSGADVPWSDEGVLGTEAGVVATQEMVTTLVPLMQGRDNTLVESQNWLGQLQHVMLRLRRPNGSWPTVQQLTLLQREQLNGTLAGTLSALEQIPGTLETKSVPDIPSIPEKRR